MLLNTLLIVKGHTGGYHGLHESGEHPIWNQNVIVGIEHEGVRRLLPVLVGLPPEEAAVNIMEISKYTIVESWDRAGSSEDKFNGRFEMCQFEELKVPGP